MCTNSTTKQGPCDIDTAMDREKQVLYSSDGESIPPQDNLDKHVSLTRPDFIKP